MKMLKNHYTASIIINTYNDDQLLLDAAIDSYLEQKEVDIQIILTTVEGDPALETLNLKYANHSQIDCCICALEQHPGRGPEGIYFQLNAATALIKHHWFAYASGNDVALPTKIRDEIDICIAQNKKVCYSAFIVTDHRLNHRELRSFKNYDYDRHLKGNFVNDCALVESALLKKYLPFDETHGNHAYWDLWLRIFKGEGNVFSYNSKASWLYRTTQSSQHVMRRKHAGKLKANKATASRMIAAHLKRARLTIFCVLGNRMTLEPSSGDQINEINLLKALSFFADVYYNGQLFHSEKTDFGLKKKPILPPTAPYDLYYVRNNLDLFSILPRPKLWVAAPYYESAFKDADAVVTFTRSWSHKLNTYQEERHRGLYEGAITQPKEILTFEQVLDPIFKPYPSHPKTHYYRRMFEGDFVIAHFGRVSETCYPHSLLNAIPIIRSRYPEKVIKLIYCGLKSQFKKKITSTLIDVLDPIPYEDMPYAIAATDIVTSDYRDRTANFGGCRHVLEAMACGVPVLTGNFDVRKEQMGELYPLFWTYQDNKGRISEQAEQEMVDHISCLIERPEKGKAIGRELRQQSDYYHLEKSAARLEKIIRMFIGNDHRHSAKFQKPSKFKVYAWFFRNYYTRVIGKLRRLSSALR